MVNHGFLWQFFELEGPPFGSGQPLYTSVALCNYVTNGDIEKIFHFLTVKRTVGSEDTIGGSVGYRLVW